MRTWALGRLGYVAAAVDPFEHPEKSRPCQASPTTRASVGGAGSPCLRSATPPPWCTAGARVVEPHHRLQRSSNE